MNKTKRRSFRQKRNRNRRSNTKRRMQRAGGLGFSSPKLPAEQKGLFHYDENEKASGNFVGNLTDTEIKVSDFLTENESNWDLRQKYYFYKDPTMAKLQNIGRFRNMYDGHYTFRTNYGFVKELWLKNFTNLYFIDLNNVDESNLTRLMD